MALCTSLYAPLGYLEIAFRNHLHTALTQHTGRKTWYESGSLLKTLEWRRVEEARRALDKRVAAVNPDQVVAELSFGFWTSLLSTDYEQVLWPGLLAKVFPHIPRRQRTRKNIASRMHGLRRLRNRVFHHEPIWRLPDLAQRYAQLRETLTWFDPDLPRLLPEDLIFEKVHARGPESHEQEVIDELSPT